MRRSLAIAAVLVATACGSASRLPTQPTAITPAESRTFTAFGVVRDTLGRLLPQATVQVVSGPAAGATATTNANGRFEFPQRFQETVRVRASKAGYLDETKDITYASLLNPLFTPYFQLPSSVPLHDLSGVWTLQFRVDPSCADELPAHLRQREYTTRVGRPGSFAILTLEGGMFTPNRGYEYGSNVIYASFFANEASLYIEDPPLGETFSSTERFLMSGHATGDLSERETTLPFSGTFAFCQDGGEYNCAECPSSFHQLTVIR